MDIGIFFFLRKSLEKEIRIFKEFYFVKEIKLVKYKYSIFGGLKYKVNIIIWIEIGFDREVFFLKCFYIIGIIYK